MICVNLVDETTRVKHIRFFVVPATSKRHFECSPDDALPLRSVVRISRRLEAGRTCGRIGKFLWYRLIATPTAGHGRQPSVDRRAAPVTTR
jgi:hypothetical protein